MPSCGGGGGDGKTVTGLPYIYAELISLPTGSSLPGYQNASVFVMDYDTHTVYTNLVVTMNGIGLVYNSASKEYEGDIVVAPGDSVIISVAWFEGNRWLTYSSYATQLASYPTIIEPTPGASWSAGLPHTIKWSGDYPKTDTFLGVGIMDPADPEGLLLWPSDGYLQEVSSNETSYTIPANSLTSGNRLVIVAIGKEFSVSSIAPYEPSHNAAPGSTFVVGGFNHVPIAVTP
jgi:hypothetical protein